MMYAFQSELGQEYEQNYPRQAMFVALDLERFWERVRRPYRRRAIPLSEMVPTAQEIYEARGLEPLTLISEEEGIYPGRLVHWAKRDGFIPRILLAADWKGVRREYLFGNRMEILAILRANTPSEENTTLNGARLVQSSRLAEVSCETGLSMLKKPNPSTS